MNRDSVCRRIVGNIEGIDAERKFLKERRDRLKIDLANARSKLGREISDRSGSGAGSLRVPRRRNPVGIGLDIISAIGQTIHNNREDVRALESRVAEISRELEHVENEIRQKEFNLRDQQSEFNRFECFDLG